MLILLPIRRRTPQEGLKVVILFTPNASLQARLAFALLRRKIGRLQPRNGIAWLYLPTLIVRNDSLYPGILPSAAARISPTA